MALQEGWGPAGGRQRGRGAFPIGSRGVGVLLARDGKGCFSSYEECERGLFQREVEVLLAGDGESAIVEEKKKVEPNSLGATI